MISIIIFSIAFLLGAHLLTKSTHLSTRELYVYIMSSVGHLTGALIYARWTTDSLFNFFPNATPDFHGFGTSFVLNLTWIVREYITGDSFSDTIFFFSALSLLGSVMWYKIFLLLERQAINSNNTNRAFYAFIIMCWPSYFLFTNGIGKDSGCFLFIPCLIYSFIRIYIHRASAFHSALALLSLSYLACVRPYLLGIITISYFSTTLFNNTSNTKKALYLVMTLSAIYWVANVQYIKHSSDMTVVGRMTFQQNHQSHGSYFYMPKSTLLKILLLPYSFTMNALGPLFIASLNIQNIMASLENSCLVLIVISVIKQFKFFYMQLDIKIKHCLNVMVSFSVTGILLLSVINTNYGLAMRQKSMYIPVLLVLFSLIKRCSISVNSVRFKELGAQT